jgi:hypothetical protein
LEITPEFGSCASQGLKLPAAQPDMKTTLIKTLLSQSSRTHSFGIIRYLGNLGISMGVNRIAGYKIQLS